MGWWFMLSEMSFLVLRLVGPLQSWGYDSQYNRRNTGLMPTKSGIAGICCAALGYLRGGTAEREFLIEFANVQMTAIAIPRQGTKKDLAVQRLQDYHTVQNTKTAEGKTKDCHITHRQYLTDSCFGVILEGNASFLNKIVYDQPGLANPKWGIWLGRKTCIPATPVFAGLRDDKHDALRLLIGEESLESFTRQEEANTFNEGSDSLVDMPVSFATESRMFSPRRVRTFQRGR